MEKVVGRAGRKLDAEVGVRLDSVVHNLHERVLFFSRPGGEGEPSSAFENAAGFEHGVCRRAEVE